MDVKQLEAQFQAFEQLSVGDERRKEAIDGWEAAILSGQIRVETLVLTAFLTDSRSAARIFAYLVLQHEAHAPDLTVMRGGVEREWERIRRQGMAPGISTMSLYYAIRMYVGQLKQRPPLNGSAAQDAQLFLGIAESLPRSLDRGGQIGGKLQEFARLVEGDKALPSDTSIAVAQIAKSGVIDAARTAQETALETERMRASAALRAERLKSRTAYVVAAIGAFAATVVGVANLRGDPLAKSSVSNPTAAAVERNLTMPDTCKPTPEGGFNSDASNGVEYDAARWVFGDAQRALGRLVRGAEDAEIPKDLGRKSIVLERQPVIQAGTERFAEPDRTDFTRIEWILPKEWHRKGLRVNATLRWEGVRPFAATGRTSTVAVNFKADVPAGYGLRESRVQRGTTQSVVSSKVENAYQVLIAEATPSLSWTRFTFPVYRPPANAATVTLRMGLHAVYGRLYIDDVSFDLCE